MTIDTEEIVISGISGRFPESENFDEFAENLFANKDLITEDERRWPKGKKISKIYFFCHYII
jgi:fatty acid synthase